MDVVADTPGRIRIKPVDGPACRNVKLVATELHRLQGRRDRICRAGGVTDGVTGGLVPDSRPDSPERVPTDYDGHGRAMH